jgi:hypothetical protein
VYFQEGGKQKKVYRAEVCRYYIHLRNLNLNSFKMVNAFGLKAIASRYHSVASELIQVYRNLPIGSKVVRRDRQRQTSW